MIDTSEALRLLRSATEAAESLDGQIIPDRERGKDRQAQFAELLKNLLQLAHLCDKTRVVVLDQYHAARGFHDHLSRGGTS